MIRTLHTVFVPKPSHVSYGDVLGGLRAWLDSRKMPTAGFKITTDGRIGFEVTMATEYAAEQLRHFVWPRA